MKPFGVVPTDLSQGGIFHLVQGLPASETVDHFGFVNPNHTPRYGVVVGVLSSAHRRLKDLFRRLS